jgi:Protein of unknown function (DUF3313)
MIQRKYAMNKLLRLTLASLTVSLAACGTTMNTSQSGFLSSYRDLTPNADASASTLRPTEAIDPSRVRLGEIEWRGNGKTDLSTEEQTQLVSLLRTELQSRLAQMPQNTGGRAVVIRAAITRVEVVSPALNTLSTVFLFAPLDRGGVATEFEAIDGNTGKQLGAMTAGYYAPLSELSARFSKLAPAELAIKKAAEDFTLLLQPASVK